MKSETVSDLLDFARAMDRKQQADFLVSHRTLEGSSLCHAMEISRVSVHPSTTAKCQNGQQEEYFHTQAQVSALSI